MDNAEIARRFASLSTANVADGCLRAGIPVRCGPHDLVAALPGSRLAGRVAPARHAGSVDVFLEAIQAAAPGDVLVADNGGRTDESCIGDLMALEAQAASIAGIAIWGLHRDTADLLAIGLPLFSTGSIPTGPLAAGPRTADALQAATVGDWTVTRDDAVFGDEDGVLFVPLDALDGVLGHAQAIRDTERAQADGIRSGTTLREQVQFERFLERRAAEPGLTLREHLRTVGGEIEV
ncbi:demethylmenaquinone methyltransferase [soil metagenome]